MMSIPFEIPEIHAGFSEAKGIIRVEEEFLIFEFRMHTMGLFKQPFEVVKIEVAALSDIRLTKHIFRDRLYIRPKTERLLNTIPGKHLGEVKLLVWRKYRATALSLVDDIQFQIRKTRRAASLS